MRITLKNVVSGLSFEYWWSAAHLTKDFVLVRKPVWLCRLLIALSLHLVMRILIYHSAVKTLSVLVLWISELVRIVTML
jgi:hypothetical protein